MNNDQIINEFLDYNSIVKGLADGTVKRQRGHLSAFLGGRDPFLIKRQDIINYIKQLRATDHTPDTCNNILSSIRSFFDFLVIFHNLGANPVAGVPKMKTQIRVPKYITKEVLERVLTGINPVDFKTAQAFAVISTLYMAGLRSSELRHLQDNDINFHQRYIVVREGKGAKDRIVPMSDRLGYALRRWQVERDHVLGTTETTFCDRHGQPMSSHQLEYIIQQAFEGECPSDLCHPHALRHSFATICMAAGVPLQKIALWMGHSSINTTMHYLTISPVYLHQEFNNIF